MGYEKFIQDADFCASLHRYLEGIQIDENQLAFSAFQEVGPGKHFFGCAHTVENYRAAFWESDVADNGPFEKWQETGELDATDRSAIRVKRLLSEYQIPALDPAIDDALKDFVARRKTSLADQWY